MPSILKSLKSTIAYLYIRGKIIARPNLRRSVDIAPKLDFWAESNKNILQALKEYSFLYTIYCRLGIKRTSRIDPIHTKEMIYKDTGILKNISNTPDNYYNSFLAIKKDWEKRENKIKKVLWTKWFRHTNYAQKSFGLRTSCDKKDLKDMKHYVNDINYVIDNLKPVLSNYDFENLSNYCFAYFNLMLGYSYSSDLAFVVNVNWEKVFGYDEKHISKNQKNTFKKLINKAREVIKLQRDYHNRLYSKNEEEK